VKIDCRKEIQMKLEDLCPIEKWAELENDIRNRSGLNAAVFNPDGIRLIDTPEFPNQLCPEIKAIPKGQSFICATAHMNIANQARQAREPVLEECDAGLIKLVVPIFVDDMFLGAFGACGLLLEDGEVDSFLVNKMTDIAEETVERLAKGIRRISKQSADELSTYIEQQIDAIIAQYQSCKESKASC
jgi:ligand-binding sensor protein